ncbi:hypothetical protein D3C72_2535850 [compost metagenome]
MINNTLRRALLVGDKAGLLKKDITADELKNLQQKLTEALREIQRVIEPSVQP